MEASFDVLDNNYGYYHIVENNNSIYSIKFKNIGGSIKVYSIKDDDLNDLYYINTITVPDGECTITFELDVPDTINVVLVTSQEIEYAEVTNK